MGFAENLVERLEQSLSSLSRAERKVALAVLSDPARATRSSIAQVAEDANVSEPTVNRFCRSLKCQGFPDFKLRLAQSLASSITPAMREAIREKDTTENVYEKVSVTIAAAVAEARFNCEAKLLDTVVHTLATSRSVEIFGLGSTAGSALDANYRLFQLLPNCTALVDPLVQRMSASLKEVGDTVLIFSMSGQSAPLVRAADMASASGAEVLAICPKQSALAKASTLVLPIAPDEILNPFAPACYRAVAHAMIETIAIGLAIRMGRKAEERINRAYESLALTRVPQG